ncbi:MAG: elongation factor P maturation arginine rhamnosyltransferase EarP, partial [Methylotenera sp.]
IAKFFGKDSLEIGETLTRKNLTVQVLPFLSQADYDQLLHSCDLNFVRGEDSWVRAIWAGKPFIWQPYIQTENAHLEKLNAFLVTFYANFEQKEMLCEAYQCWSAGHMPNDVLQRYLNNLPATQAYTFARAKQLAAQTDLAAKLVIFCNNARL